MRAITSYSRVQVWIGKLLRNRRFQISRVVRQKRLLNVGCGGNTHPEFVNLDYAWRPGMDVCWDITRGIPLDDGSMDGIYSEHCLEHIEHEQCVVVLREFFRVLVPGGVVRIVVPHGGLYLDLYAKARSGSPVSFPYVGPEGERDRLEDSRYGFTPMMAVNRIFRGYGHLFAYDYDTLAGFLAAAGFSDIREACFGEGRMTSLLIDSELRRPQSLYVEAAKR